MAKISKKMMYAQNLQQQESLFACPICQSEMHVHHLSQLVCGRNHSFDIAKQGYINFLNKPLKTQYHKALFDARQHILSHTTLYKSVIDRIVQLIEQYVQASEIRIVDMGCGEGSHLSHISEKTSRPNIGIGFDISKEAIMTATTYNNSIMCAVADIAHVPLKANQADVVLNFLSPSNYAEFNRIVRDDGIIIKVIPNTHYLQEIREALFGTMTDEQAYSNEDVVHLFHKTYDVIALQTVNEVHDIAKDTLQHLIKMTPLTWSASEQEFEQLASKPIEQITIDLDILVGKKHT